MDYFKRAEKMLYDVGTKGDLQNKLKNYERLYDKEIRRICPSGIAPIDYSKPTVMSSRPEDDFVAADNIAYYRSMIIQTRDEIENIMIVAKQLPDELFNIIRLWYFERKTKEQIAKELFYESTTTVYRKRKKAIKIFVSIYPW